MPPRKQIEPLEDTLDLNAEREFMFQNNLKKRDSLQQRFLLLEDSCQKRKKKEKYFVNKKKSQLQQDY